MQSSWRSHPQPRQSGSCQRPGHRTGDGESSECRSLRGGRCRPSGGAGRSSAGGSGTGGEHPGRAERRQFAGPAGARCRPMHGSRCRATGRLLDIGGSGPHDRGARPGSLLVWPQQYNRPHHLCSNRAQGGGEHRAPPASPSGLEVQAWPPPPRRPSPGCRTSSPAASSVPDFGRIAPRLRVWGSESLPGRTTGAGQFRDSGIRERSC
jgi:hypothetical protein